MVEEEERRPWRQGFCLQLPRAEGLGGEADRIIEGLSQLPGSSQQPPPANSVTSMSLSFLTSKMGVIASIG